MIVKRKLTTILVMDVVGYSGLMAADEEGTLSSLKTMFREIVDPTLAQFHGRIVKLMGDGALIEFESAVDAVKFGVAVQQLICESNEEVAPDKNILFRVGINIGDVVIDDNDIHGNGVNIASRLEGLAEPGGICVSETVVSHVRGNVDVGFHDCGMQQVKNIPQSIHVFRVIMGGEAESQIADNSTFPSSSKNAASIDKSSPPGDFTDIDLSVPDSPSIAVLPFTNMSADSDQEFFSDGITEDIITALSKIKGLLVVARNSTFVYKGQSVDIKQVSREQGVRYVLEGSVRKAGDRIRVTAQLIDATSGHHLWAEKYDREVEDIFAVQDDITKEVIIALDVRLSGGEQALIWSSGTEILEAWELVRKGMDLLNHINTSTSKKSINLCQQALEIDPEYALAWVIQGLAHHLIADQLRRENTVEANSALASAFDCGNKALKLDPSCADAFSLLSICHLSSYEYDKAVAMSNKAIALAPSHSEILAISAIVYSKAGQPQRSLERIKMAMRCCPIYPLWFLWVLGMAYRFNNQLEAGISVTETAISRGLSYLPAYVNLASMYGELNEPEKARKAIVEILRQEPDFSIEKYTALLSYKNPQDMKHFKDGLHNTELPE